MYVSLMHMYALCIMQYASVIVLPCFRNKSGWTEATLSLSSNFLDCQLCSQNSEHYSRKILLYKHFKQCKSIHVKMGILQ